MTSWRNRKASIHSQFMSHKYRKATRHCKPVKLYENIFISVALNVQRTSSFQISGLVSVRSKTMAKEM